MNERAANALYEAERKGVRQIVGDYHDGMDGFCALGVLGFTLTGSVDTGALRDLCGFNRAEMDCPDCGLAVGGEFQLVHHMNDIHRRTFGEIARKLGPDHA